MSSLKPAIHEYAKQIRSLHERGNRSVLAWHGEKDSISNHFQFSWLCAIWNRPVGECILGGKFLGSVQSGEGLRYTLGKQSQRDWSEAAVAWPSVSLLNGCAKKQNGVECHANMKTPRQNRSPVRKRVGSDVA
ncbi:hypothetical protein AVEN_53814-1 [Araneus ventricosus]|uniref:Uncharacterized protein n=1 Tax=Araneus ventricosus TaxID=182803 RepID=A0A4Y2KB37_ARAVE|nr:hypothetical protein AVEN_53814-1 [Araneus ventricosus]